jgi:hypothetical protein
MEAAVHGVRRSFRLGTPAERTHDYGSCAENLHQGKFEENSS